MVQLDLFGNTWQQRFDKWLQTDAGEEVANRFIALALQMKSKGFGSYGAKAIVEVIRWEHHLQHGPNDSSFKINNNYTAYLARYAMTQEPLLDSFFNLREATIPKKAVVVTIKTKEATND